MQERRITKNSRLTLDEKCAKLKLATRLIVKK